MADVAPAVVVAGELVVRPAVGDRRGDVLGGEHAGQDGVVAALDARHVDEAGGAADQRPAGEASASAPTGSRPR